jgi:hypothetical protein
VCHIIQAAAVLHHADSSFTNMQATQDDDEGETPQLNKHLFVAYEAEQGLADVSGLAYRLALVNFF